MKKIVGVVAFMCILFLCIFMPGNIRVENKMKNVEERDFASFLLIEKGEENQYLYIIGIANEKLQDGKRDKETVYTYQCRNLEELRNQYQRNQGKVLSLAHIKILLFYGWDTLTDMNHMIMDLCRDREVAKTIYVLRVQNETTWRESFENSEKPFADSIWQVVTSFEEYRDVIPRLEDYVKAIREGSPWYIYNLNITKQGILLEKSNHG